MLTDDEITAKAIQHIQQFLNDCECSNSKEGGDALGFIIAYAGQALLGAFGKSDGLEELARIHSFIASAVPANIEFIRVKKEKGD